MKQKCLRRNSNKNVGSINLIMRDQGPWNSRLRRTALFSIILIINALTVFSQNTNITGTVRSSDENMALPGVNISIQGTTIGTVTDGNGNYSIAVPDAGTGKLLFSYVGYLAQEVAVNGRTIIDVVLDLDSKSLEEIVVVGYGSQKKSDLTGSISQVKAEDIAKLSVSSLEQAMQGQAAGVRVTMASGAPGSEANVIIRGMGSINPVNNPLYIVDGIALTGGIGSINTSDIASIEILKDASASAIYGARGSNGVVLITTKKGEGGDMKVNFNMYQGTQDVWKRMDMMNGQQWAETQNAGITNDPNTLAPNPFTWDPVNMETRQGIVDSTDWQDLMFRPGVKKNYYLSVNGGNEKSNFLTSFGYYDHEGVVLNSFYKRYTLRFNSSHKVKDWLTIGNNISYMRAQNRRVTENGDRRSAVLNILRSSPLINYEYNEEGGYYGGSTDAQYYGEANSPYRMALQENGEYYTNYIIGNVYAEIELMKNLVFHSDVGLNYEMDDWKNFYVPLLEYQFKTGTPVASLHNAINTRQKSEIKNYLSYHFENDKHSFTALLGTDRESYYAENFSGSRSGFLVADVEELQYLTLGADSTAVTNGTGLDWRLESYYSRIIYSYDDKYLFTGSLRLDGSSKFSTNDESIFSKNNTRFGWFPSFSFGWKVSNEDFMENVDFLSNLKVRFGWGQLGNERGASEYPTYSVVIPGTTSRSSYYIFGSGQNGVLGLHPERMPNTLLHWETSEQTNFGVDLSAWSNRINFTADYFIKTNRDIIMPLQLPEIGRGQQGNPITNIGTIQNKGLELSFDVRNIKGAFRYNAGFNFTTTKNNKIIDMAGATLDGPNYQSLGLTTRTVEGRSIGLFYGYVCDGVFQTEEEIEAHATQKKAVPGDLIFRDIDGDRVITASDRTYIGNALPDFIYGINLGAAYKGFDLAVFFQGSYGNDILNLSRYETDFLAGDNYTNNFRTELLNSWTVDNPSTTMPRVTSTDPNNNYRISSFYVEDGSYLRLKNAQLGYSLPASLMERLKIETIRIYVSGENLLTFTHYSGWDPEIGATAAQAGTVFGTGYGLDGGGSTYAGNNDSPLSALSRGIDMGVFPQARTFLFGVNITF